MMSQRFSFGTVQESRRTAIYVVRLMDGTADELEITEIAERMREKLAARGEFASEIVVVQGAAKETLRLHGTAYAVQRVRAAMFNAAISWRPIELD